MSGISGIKFRPVMGTENIIKNTGQSNGWLYVATDTGNMYLDVDNHRISIGGAGGSGGSSSFSWADGDDETIVKAYEDEDDTTYIIDISCIEGGVIPRADTLILNSDGRFFRVSNEQSSEEGKIIANLIAVSGSGGGGSAASTKDVQLRWQERTIAQSGAIFVSGQTYYAIFIPEVIEPNTDTNCWLRFRVLKDNEIIKEKTENSIRSGSQFKFDTAWMPSGQDLTLEVTVGSPNSEYNNGAGRAYRFTGINVISIGVEKDSTMSYIPIVTPSQLTRTQNIRYISSCDYRPTSGQSVTLYQHVYVDDIEVMEKKALDSNNGSQLVSVPEQPHGVHNITIKVSTVINDTELFSDGITYQAAWAEQNNDAPIIWIGNYDDVIVNYETSYIEFMVYDPLAAAQSAAANVILYKENVEIGQMDVTYSPTAFVKWDISTVYEVGENNYSIACRTAQANISNFVTTEGSRNLGLEDEDALMMNYSTAGRMNNEVMSQRVLFKDKKHGTAAILEGFNWKNNGWASDPVGTNGIDNGAYLNIANGAKVTLPFEPIDLNRGVDYTIEMRYRIKNVQKYSTLVKTYAKYYINVGTDENPVKSSASYTKAEIDAMSETQGRTIPLYYDEYGSPVMDDKVEKQWEKEEGVVCKWMQGNNGLCIGTQEAYFASPRGVVAVRYKEDEIINISIVVSSTDNLCYIYLNGILSGADSLPPADATGAFSINSSFVINSNYCDVDLYRFRVYQGGLTMPQVIHNYLSDIHSIVLYDQNQLTAGASGDKATKLDYEKLVEYNELHPEALTMPYAVWKIISDNKKATDGKEYAELLPYYKGNKCTCEVTFVNPSLDKALEDGLIDEWYYYTHCPSFKAVGVEIDVQGTSSQGYPRRNYKTKFKNANPDKKAGYQWVFTQGSLTGQRIDKAHTVTQTQDDKHNTLATPVQRTLSKKWHVDNESLGTNKFTWKIDYMESSGTYNTGYANLMGNLQHPLYTQHPLDYYNISGVNSDDMRTTVYGFPVLTFHEYADANMNPSQPGSAYEYIGRYNLNLDKGSNEYYGFEIEKEQPYIDAPWTEKIKDDDGNVVEEIQHDHPWISQIAECWELSDNQGTWCSWRFPNAAARAAGFRTLQSGSNDKYEMMLHFEYRYSPYADQLDAIGADGKYDGSATEREKYKDEIGTSNMDYSNYAYEKYAHLEDVFKWLDSTDQTTATNSVLTEPLEIRTPKQYTDTENGESSTPVIDYAVTEEYDSSKDYFIKNSNNEYIPVDKDDLSMWGRVETYQEDGQTKTRVVDGFKDGIVYYISTIIYYNTRFEKDSKGYRLEKFRRDFDLYLNKEYCLVYYVMTELLLCYDSRGKNMMFASFGPTASSQGHYVWFPIFYDIDTQLGLNNSGAYLWDYDADVSKDGLFSTPTSVLWVNLWDAFEEDIKGKYRVLRGLDDKSNVVGSLSYENIAGAYTCDPSVFDSYAMKGIRPTIAIGLDEYYKYFATTAASKVGYFNTDGNLVLEESPTFAYACQGDKILTTELLLQNRLNYIDSWWMGGDYDIKKVKGGQLQLRVSGNRATLTSDTFLDSSETPYPVPYYDAKPGYKLKPFLKQYVSYFTDEVPGEPTPYTGGEGQEDGVWTLVPDSTLSAYKNTPETPNEQLNYIPGLDYLSSLGDLSTSYVSEFMLRKGKRLLDLILGSDAPNYKNRMISSDTIFNLAMADTDSGKKPLMKKMVFTGIETLNKALNISGSKKLQEFRALRTAIPNVYFAEGAPLHTLHLPASLRTLNLVQNNELTRILTSAPNVWEATSADDYKGLYVEGLTDANAEGTGHNIGTLIIDGGGLGYEAYKLLEKFVMVKTIPQNHSDNANYDPNAGDKTQIGMLNQQWTPYVQVEVGESYQSGTTYYQLNDHGMFDTWTFTTSADWNEQLLNGKLFTIDADKLEQQNTITNLDLFDRFLAAYDRALAANTTSKWGMKDTTSVASVPTITGTIFINNDASNPINEVMFDKNNVDGYAIRWPSLTFTAAHVKTANLSKYVRTYENGKVETLTIGRTAGNQPTLPTDLTSAPSQPYYDFAGWSLTDPYKTEGTPELVLTYNAADGSYTQSAEWSNLSFDENNTVITFYAVFTPQIYNMTYKYENGDVIEVVPCAYGSTIQLPSIVPYQDESELPLEEKYAFLGYAYTSDAAVPLDMSKIVVSRPLTFYALFDRVNVHSNPLDDRYLIFVGPKDCEDRNHNLIQGFEIALNTSYAIRGKITLPTTHMVNGIEYPVCCIQASQTSSTLNGFSHNNDGKNYITHIFWDDPENAKVFRIETNAFRSTTRLKYFEMPPSLYYLGTSCFYESACEAYAQLQYVRDIGQGSFTLNIGEESTVQIYSTTESIGSGAFSYMTNLRNFILGTPTAPTRVTGLTNQQIIWPASADPIQVTIYTDDPTNAQWSNPSTFGSQPVSIVAV